MDQRELPPQSVSDAYMKVSSEVPKDLVHFFEQDRDDLIIATEQRLERLAKFDPDTDRDLMQEASKDIKKWVEKKWKDLEYMNYCVFLRENAIDRTDDRKAQSQKKFNSSTRYRYDECRDIGVKTDVIFTNRDTKEIFDVIGITLDCKVQLKNRKSGESVLMIPSKLKEFIRREPTDK